MNESYMSGNSMTVLSASEIDEVSGGVIVLTALAVYCALSFVAGMTLGVAACAAAASFE